jgi:hypothetical protein
MNMYYFFNLMYVLYKLITILLFKSIQYSISIAINLLYGIEEIIYHIYYYYYWLLIG